MTYKVFSDESGTWNHPNDDEYYIRSWILIDSEKIIELEDKMKNIRAGLDCEELRWKHIVGAYSSSRPLEQGRQGAIEEVLSLVSGIYITISVPALIKRYIHRMNTYKVINSLDHENFTGGDIETNLCKEKILSTVENSLFILYYEKRHTHNARDVFSRYNITSWIIDEPQSTKKIWKEAINIDGVSIEKSHKSDGLQIADIVAGCYRALLKGDTEQEYNIAKDFYTSCIKYKTTYSASSPCPNIVYYDMSDSEVVTLREKIQNQIWTL